MQACEEDIQEIFNSICRARAIHDTQAIIRGFHDLEDAGIKPTIHFRMVAINGDLLEYHVNFSTDNLIVDAVNGLRDHVLCSKYCNILKSDECNKNVWKFIKHHNDMSPEEYEWCMLDDEFEENNMTIVKHFKCAFCNNNTWHLMKNRHGAEAWLQFQCAACGGTANVITYAQTIDGIEKLIDDDVRGYSGNNPSE